MNSKDFIPPVLIKLIKKIRGINSLKRYLDYSAAIQDCTSNPYQNIELCNMIAEKSVVYADKLQAKPFILNPKNTFLLSTISQYINVFLKKEITILDFGGACGTHYYEMKRLIPQHIAIKWYVVETEQMVKSAIEKGLNNTELEFVTNIKDVKNKVDIIYSSCALGYVPNPYEFTMKLLSLEANYILIDRMVFNNSNSDFITIQKSLLSSNGPGKLPVGYIDRVISYPHTTLSFNKFNSAIVSKGYELNWIFHETFGSNQLNTGNGQLYTKK